MKKLREGTMVRVNTSTGGSNLTGNMLTRRARVLRVYSQFVLVEVHSLQGKPVYREALSMDQIFEDSTLLAEASAAQQFREQKKIRRYYLSREAERQKIRFLPR